MSRIKFQDDGMIVVDLGKFVWLWTNHRVSPFPSEWHKIPKKEFERRETPKIVSAISMKHFIKKIRLTEREKDLIKTWVALNE